MANEVIEKRFGNEFTLEKTRSFRNRAKMLRSSRSDPSSQPRNPARSSDPHLEQDQGSLQLDLKDLAADEIRQGARLFVSMPEENLNISLKPFSFGI